MTSDKVVGANLFPRWNHRFANVFRVFTPRVKRATCRRL